MEGLEPPCLAALDPKSSASTNFATSAYFTNASFKHFFRPSSLIWDCKLRTNFLIILLYLQKKIFLTVENISDVFLLLRTLITYKAVIIIDESICGLLIY